MNQLIEESLRVSPFRGRRRVVIETVALLAALASATAGCAKKDTDAASSAKGPAAAVSVPGAAVTLTPAQAAAVQRANQQGPAVQAAAQEGQPPR